MEQICILSYVPFHIISNFDKTDPFVEPNTDKRVYYLHI